MLWARPDAWGHQPRAAAPRAGWAGGDPAQPLCPHSPDLHEERDGVEAENLHAVHGVPGQDVQRPCATLHNLFHLHSILPGNKSSARALTRWGTATCSVGTGYPQRQAFWVWGARLCWEQGAEVRTHRVGLLCAGGRVSLGVLVSLDQQLHQAGDDSGLLQRGMVGRTQGQVADQAYGSLEERRRKEQFVSTVDENGVCSPRDPMAAPLPVCPTPAPLWCRLTQLFPLPWIPS